MAEFLSFFPYTLNKKKPADCSDLKGNCATLQHNKPQNKDWIQSVGLLFKIPKYETPEETEFKHPILTAFA